MHNTESVILVFSNILQAFFSAQSLYLILRGFFSCFFFKPQPTYESFNNKKNAFNLRNESVLRLHITNKLEM